MANPWDGEKAIVKTGQMAEAIILSTRGRHGDSCCCALRALLPKNPAPARAAARTSNADDSDPPRSFRVLGRNWEDVQ